MKQVTIDKVQLMYFQEHKKLTEYQRWRKENPQVPKIKSR
jgi:hypothetical protein